VRNDLQLILWVSATLWLADFREFVLWCTMSLKERGGGGWGRVPFSRNLMSPTPRRKWYLTTWRRAHEMVLDPIPRSLPVHFFGSRPQPPTSPLKVEYLKLGTIEMLTRKRHACQLLVIFVSRTNDYSTSLCHSNRLSQKSACCTIAKDCDSLLR